jgi:hypothetical protein
MLRVNDGYVAASTTFPIPRQEDLSHAEIRLATYPGATIARIVGPDSTKQSVTVN